jgi:hypothetical protein
MKKLDSKKNPIRKRAVKMIEGYSETPSFSQVPIKGSSETTSYNHPPKMNAHLLEMEKLRAGGAQFVRDRNRCI